MPEEVHNNNGYLSVNNCNGGKLRNNSSFNSLSSSPPRTGSPTFAGQEM